MALSVTCNTPQTPTGHYFYSSFSQNIRVQFGHIKNARSSGDAPERAKTECFTQSSNNIIHDWLILSIFEGDII